MSLASCWKPGHGGLGLGKAGGCCTWLLSECLLRADRIFFARACSHVARSGLSNPQTGHVQPFSGCPAHVVDVTAGGAVQPRNGAFQPKPAVLVLLGAVQFRNGACPAHFFVMVLGAVQPCEGNRLCMNDNVCLYIYIYIYIQAYIYIYVCMYIYIYMYMPVRV